MLCVKTGNNKPRAKIQNILFCKFRSVSSCCCPRSATCDTPTRPHTHASQRTSMEEFRAFIDSHADEYVARLAEIVAIESVSSEPARRPAVFAAVDWAAAWAEKLGGKYTKVENGTQVHPSGETLALPPILLATFGSDPKKKTVCVYGHLDVQPANLVSACSMCLSS